jgi:hypothetical protein
MQRLRQLEWNAAKIGGKAVMTDAMTGARDDRTDVTRGVVPEANPRAQEAVPAQNSVSGGHTV